MSAQSFRPTHDPVQELNIRSARALGRIAATAIVRPRCPYRDRQLVAAWCEGYKGW